MFQLLFTDVVIQDPIHMFEHDFATYIQIL